MTLVQVLANEMSVHMACDFRLTDPYTGAVRRLDAHKLITFDRPAVSALIGVTGVAVLGGKPVGDWISAAIADLERDATVEDISDFLMQAETPLSQVADPFARRTTFVIASIIGTQSMVTLVSNFEVFVKGQIRKSAVASERMTTTSVKPKGAQYFGAGQAEMVRGQQREELKLSLRADPPDSKVQEDLRQVNQAVSHLTSTVSAGCYVASLHATGHGSAQPFLTTEQQGDFIPPEFAEQLRRMGVQLNPQIGPDGRPMPIRMVQSVSAKAGGTAEYYREQLKLQPENAEVWNNYGSFLAGKRCMEEAIRAFEKAVELNPLYATALANLANKMWLVKGEVAEADRLYQKAVEVSGDSAPGWILSDYAALCDAGLSDSERAGQLHHLAAQDENFPIGRARQALFMLKTGNDPEGANIILAEAIKSQPENPQILFLAAQADWYYNNKRREALAKLHKSCSLDQNNLEALKLAANACIRLGDPASASYYYRKRIKRGEDNPQINNDYAVALLMDGKHEGALRHLTRAQRKSSNEQISLCIRVNRAATLWALRRRDEAITSMGEILHSTLSPEIELEVLAMLQIAGHTSAKDRERLHQLVESGVHAGSYCIRGMVRNLPRKEREAGQRLANMIAGITGSP